MLRKSSLYRERNEKAVESRIGTSFTTTWRRVRHSLIQLIILSLSVSGANNAMIMITLVIIPNLSVF